MKRILSLLVVTAATLWIAWPYAQRVVIRNGGDPDNPSSGGACGGCYYVRTDGNNSNTGLANTAGGAWRTIDHAADRVAAGATVRVQAGTYSEIVTPAISGSPGNTITFVADGAVTMCGWTFNDSSYIRVIGFTLDTGAGTCTRANTVVTVNGTSTGMEFWNNEIRNAIGTGISQSASGRFHSGILIGNTIHDLGANGSGGSGMGVVVRGNHNLSAYNELYDLYPDGMVIDGTHSRWLNNYFHGMSEREGGHPDLYQAGSSALGLAYNVFESTFQLGMGNSANEHSAQISNVGPLASNAFCGGGACGAMTENIWRRNVWHHVANGGMPGINQNDYAAVSDTRYYHNTTVEANRDCPTCRNDVAWYGPNTPGGFIYNNIHYDAWGSSASVNMNVYTVDGTLAADYNLAYGSGGAASFIAPWTSQAHPQSNVNPNLVNVAGDDFHLAAGSGDGANARSTGGPLTRATSCSGTTLSVASNSGGFFVGSNASNLPQYGGGLVPGDTITVSNSSRTVASVSGDAITLTSSVTCSSGNPVYFGDDTTPDIGAYPYKAGGYSLSAKYAGSGTITITPNDASLVRFVVCYNRNVPYEVDNTSPYTCTAPVGTFSARVYPLYPSKTLWAIATP